MQSSDEKQHRKPTRLKDYNYSQTGAYFITICTKDRKELLCKIKVGFGIYDEPETTMSEFGFVAQKNLEREYKNIKIDRYVIMPDHIHILVRVINDDGVSQAPHPTNAQIPKFVSLFKRYCNRQYGYNIWQKSYFDHIIRSEEDFLEHLKYMENNPYKWCEKTKNIE